MTDVNQDNSKILLDRIMALEQRERERDSLDAVKKVQSQTLSKEELIKGIFQGAGKPVHVPDRGLKYPKYMAHPWKIAENGQPAYELARDEFHEQEIAARFAADVEPASNSNGHVEPEVEKPKRGRPKKVETQ